MLGNLLSVERLFGKAWHVNGGLIHRYLSWVENAGTPIGALTPDWVGQTVQDTATGDLYVATGLTSADWRRYASGPTGKRQLLLPMLHGKVGATAGWVITAGNNVGSATLPAGQTASTLVLPVVGLEVGDIIKDWAVNGQAESAGNTATLSADLRKLTIAAADLVDASVSTDASGNLTADTIISRANVGVAENSLSEAVIEASIYYFLLTGTTAALTDLDIANISLGVQRRS